MRSCPYLLVLVAVVLDKSGRAMSRAPQNQERTTGTVLFERSDSSKYCWTKEDFILLSSRRAFQDLLPKVDPSNFANDQYLDLLTDYLELCLEAVANGSRGKARHLTLKALADSIGGYLRSRLLPGAKRGYYAGSVKYRTMSRLVRLYDRLRSFLGTDGAGWTAPNKETGGLKISPILVTPGKAACKGLLVYSTPSEGDENQEPGIEKNRRVTRGGHGHSKKSNAHKQEPEIVIPLPFLDNDAQPNSIALPFERNSLHSIYCECSAFILVKFYVASAGCIGSRSKAGLEQFNRNFSQWLHQSVVRHLDDEKWYPAFGGVLRVIAALEKYAPSKKGMGSVVAQGEPSGFDQTMPESGNEFSSIQGEGAPTAYEQGENQAGATFGTTELISIAVISVLLLWLLIGLCLVCYRFLRKRPDECPPCKLTDPPVAVLYENADYCQTDTCPGRRRGLLGGLKDWWRQRFGKCPAGCQEGTEEERCLAAISYTSKETNDNKISQRRKYSKCVVTSPTPSMRDRASFKARKTVCYSSDDSITTNSESPRKPR